MTEECAISKLYQKVEAENAALKARLERLEGAARIAFSKIVVEGKYWDATRTLRAALDLLDAGKGEGVCKKQK